MNALSSSAYLNEAARRADADTEMRVFSSTKAIHLRINKQAIASISTRLIAQEQTARTIAKRYNTHQQLVDALQFVMDNGLLQGQYNIHQQASDIVTEALKAAR